MPASAASRAAKTPAMPPPAPRMSTGLGGADVAVAGGTAVAVAAGVAVRLARAVGEGVGGAVAARVGVTSPPGVAVSVGAPTRKGA